MGHIPHLKNKILEINKLEQRYNYTCKLVNSGHHLPLGKNVTFI